MSFPAGAWRVRRGSAYWPAHQVATVLRRQVPVDNPEYRLAFAVIERTLLDAAAGAHADDARRHVRLGWLDIWLDVLGIDHGFFHSLCERVGLSFDPLDAEEVA